MADLGSLVVNLEANIAKFESGMKQAEQITSKVMGGIQSVTANAISIAEKAAIGFAAAWSMDKFLSGIVGAQKSAAALYDLSIKSGATVDALSGMGAMAKQSGTDMDSVAMALGKLSRAMLDASQGGAKNEDLFRRFGVAVTDGSLKLRDSGDVMMDLAKKFNMLESGTLKVAYAQEFLGKSGAQMLPFMKKLADAGEHNVKLTSQQAFEANKLELAQAKLEARNGALAKVISTAITPTMRDFNEALLSSDSFMTKLTSAVKDLEKDGTLASWAQTGARAIYGMIDALDLVGRGFKQTGKLIGGAAAFATTGDYANTLGAAIADATVIAMAPPPSAALEKIFAKRAAGGQKGDFEPGTWNPGMPSVSTVGVPGFQMPKLSEFEKYTQSLEDQAIHATQGKYDMMLLHGQAIANRQNSAEGQRAGLPFADMGAVTSRVATIKAGDELKMQQEYARGIEKTTQAYLSQNAVVAMSAHEREQYNIARQGELQLADTIAKAEQNRLQLSLEAIDTLTAATKAGVDAQLAALQDRYAKERDWQTGASLALKNYADDATNQAKNMGTMFTNAFRGMEDALTQMVATGKADFKSLADSIIADLVRIQIRENITGPLAKASSSLFGSAGQSAWSWASSFFKADGGPVAGGTPYIVGEEGPEWFVPSSSGVILPNGTAPVAMESSRTASITFNVQAMDARSFQSAMVQNRAVVVGIVNQALNASGRMGIGQGYA
ncbi:MAG: hypothetical protein H7839_04775 [Magnetococcus sp. YQC-5]